MKNSKKIIIAILVIVLVSFYLQYQYTHTFKYKWDQAIQKCIQTGDRTQDSCYQKQMRDYIDGCKLLEPDKTDQECENYLKSDYNN